MKKSLTQLSDGRELIFYDIDDSAVRDAVDRRTLQPVPRGSETRYDPLHADWMVVAAHRQNRTFHPPADECPLCPSDAGRYSEIPAGDYDVVVFENRFPALAGEPTPKGRPGGRCEVICFSSDHDRSFAQLPASQAALVLEAWADRTTELYQRDDIEQVFLFEDRGEERTLVHPHGQIYGYPFVVPRVARVLESALKHRARTNRNIFDDLVARECAESVRLVLETEHWVAFVPYTARWPYEVHLYPRQRVADLGALAGPARDEFPVVYQEVLRRFDALFDGSASPTPYISAWLQAPRRVGRDEFALHLEVFTARRSATKVKHLAGSEHVMGVSINEISPEQAAARLRALGEGQGLTSHA
ncbi:galactose-1-phosphate uridylyltransferase [Micromonospora sp. WMMD998]|uniref:galactose-1-phosphate uridylyltransferase n=1 Tax=Micromonospora sp. WMMD998 TaxID=3016092 RepID=UPI00249B6496|nr:galactose-1-phosphate uridylyltransferase [Micromonospora sp. WMMD998]WFE41131.1 galactose-1-phosphate uridylyltransferase [Micromonospora sp. WMMD998]